MQKDMRDALRHAQVWTTLSATADGHGRRSTVVNTRRCRRAAAKFSKFQREVLFLELPESSYSTNVGCVNGSLYAKNDLDLIVCFDAIPACDRQTDTGP